MEYVNTFQPPDDPSYEDAASILRALAHPVRLRIVAGLLDGSCCVGPMTACLGIPQPQVSRHLAVLREAGVVAAETVGRERHYRVDHPLAPALMRLLLRPPG